MKKSVYILMLGLLSLSLLASAGCNSINKNQISVNTAMPSPRATAIKQKTIIDWVDFLKVKGISYLSTWNGVLTDVSKLGKEIGRVGFQVADHVQDASYVIKDGDAAFLSIGTIIYSIEGYPDHEVVAVEDASVIGGYKLYITTDKQSKLGLTFEEVAQHEISKISLYVTTDIGKPIVELKDGRQVFLLSLFQRASQDKAVDVKPAANPKYYNFVIDSGTAIGYIDTFYKDGNNYYWNHPELKELQSAFAYYFANERDVVFTIQGLDFPFTNHMDWVASGERIKRDGNIENITLIGADGGAERVLFAQETIDQLKKKAKKINPSDGEDKAILFMASNAMPVSNGQLIAYTTNKDTIVKEKRGAFNIHLIGLDGTGDRMIIDGSKYGGSIHLLDSVGDRIVAGGGDHSLLDISISTGAVRQNPINGIVDALSVDGRYVLYRKMVGDSQVGTELAAFDLEQKTSLDLGEMPKNYVFAQGVK